MNGRVGIIGDLHSEDRRLKAVLDFFEKSQVDSIVCTGDIADGRGNIDRSCELLKSFSVTCVRGNHDRWLINNKVRHIPNAHFCSDLHSDSVAFLNHLQPVERLAIGNDTLVLCHGVLDRDMQKVWPGTERTRIERSKNFDGLLTQESPRFVVNGHIHYRTLIDFEDCFLINAGTLRGDRPAATILDVHQGTVVGYTMKDDSVMVRGATISLSERDDRRIWKNTQEFDGTWIPVVLS